MTTLIDTPRWKVASKAARDLAADYSSPPVPVLEIAERSGVNVVFTDFKDHAEKVAGFCDFATQRIYVNKNDSVGRQNFTMAHELGHWVLHRDLFMQHPEKYRILARFQQPEQGNVLEIEANFFAANLLVPVRLLDPVRTAPVAVLTDIFCVSREMMENRLKKQNG